ncbi:MAG: altronate dehydratase family protein [Pseudomonadota bacterium]
MSQANTNANTIRLHAADSVVIALTNLEAGTELADIPCTLASDVGRGHKIATRAIATGENVLRYGQIIGQATQDIALGDHVHVHNLAMADHKQDHDLSAAPNPLPAIDDARTFLGYRRADGKSGTRNYLGIVTTVNCSGSVARFIADEAAKRGFAERFPGVDGIVPIVHGTGCGMASGNEGYQALFRTLSGYACHPNFAGILLLGLGCEMMQLSHLVDGRKIRQDGNLRYMNIQQAGGTAKTVEAGLAILEDMAADAAKLQREPIPVSELMVGMQCGGSDGYSGITANPALGHASDLLVRRGGTTILSETSEVYGAEHLLTARATADVGQKLLDRIKWWEDYTERNGGEMNNNPSPGNKRGGLTTILEKSLGAVAKGGSAPMEDVYLFAERIDKHGFVFMDSPGYDPCSVTGQIASGANLVVFTTGRGSVSGYMPTPCIKLATNSEMYGRMKGDMDINCGDIISEGATIEAKGAEIFEKLVRVASGEKTKSEALGFGGAEFVPWQIGAVM